MVGTVAGDRVVRPTPRAEQPRDDRLLHVQARDLPRVSPRAALRPRRVRAPRTRSISSSSPATPSTRFGWTGGELMSGSPRTAIVPKSVSVNWPRRTTRGPTTPMKLLSTSDCLIAEERHTPHFVCCRASTQASENGRTTPLVSSVLLIGRDGYSTISYRTHPSFRLFCATQSGY